MKVFVLSKEGKPLTPTTPRREKGAFIIRDVVSGKKLAEVTPRKLVRVARPTRGWMIV